MRLLKGHNGPVRCLAYTRDGSVLASGGDDGTVRRWAQAAGKGRLAGAGHTDCVRALAFSPDGVQLASASWDDTVRRRRPHDGLVGQVAFTQRSLLSVGWDGTVRQWDVASGRETAAYAWEAGRLLCLAGAPDGMTAAAGAENGSIVIWDLEE